MIFPGGFFFFFLKFMLDFVLFKVACTMTGGIPTMEGYRNLTFDLIPYSSKQFRVTKWFPIHKLSANVG